MAALLELQLEKYFWFTSHHDTSYQGSSQLTFRFRRNSKLIFKMAATLNLCSLTEKGKSQISFFDLAQEPTSPFPYDVVIALCVCACVCVRVCVYVCVFGTVCLEMSVSFPFWSVGVTEWFALTTSDHEFPGSNPVRSWIQLIRVRPFITHSLSLSPFHILDMAK